MVKINFSIKCNLDEVEVEHETNLTVSGLILFVTHLMQSHFPGSEITNDLEEATQEMLDRLIEHNHILQESLFYEQDFSDN